MRKRIEKGISIKPAKFGTDRFVREQNEAYEKLVEELNTRLFDNRVIKGIGSGSKLLNEAADEIWKGKSK